MFARNRNLIVSGAVIVGINYINQLFKFNMWGSALMCLHAGYLNHLFNFNMCQVRLSCLYSGLVSGIVLERYSQYDYVFHSITVAILAQGTSRAVAATQAFIVVAHRKRALS